MRVLICGDRNYNDYMEFCNTIHSLLDFTSLQDFFIISGGARGADSMAEKFAIEKDIPYQIFPADWEKYGKAAGPIRNKQMLDEGKPDMVIAFLAPNSRGTANMIKQAEEADIPVRVINVK